MIKHYADLAVSPETYADYRPVFENQRLNVTHVHIHPGDTVPAHTHVDEDQIYYVATGSGFVILDGKRTDVKAGDCVIIPVGTEHEITAVGPDPLDYVFFVTFIPARA